MRCTILLFLIYFDISESKLWSKGVVHYSINPKDYDIHSQDEIISTFTALEKEICVKFFNTPLNHSETVLFISNPDKRKSCPPQQYNYTGSVVEMPIGYKCLNKNDIARITIGMLRASIDQSAAPINSYDLVKQFEEQDQTKVRPTFLTTEDRNYINAHYHGECSTLSQRATLVSARRSDDGGVSLGEENINWYKERVWPLGVVMYSVDPALRDTPDHKALKFAMTQIELVTCVVFHDSSPDDDQFAPANQLVFKEEGEDEPELGLKPGDQNRDHKALKFAMTQIELAISVVFHDSSPDNDHFAPANQLVFKEEGEDEPELGLKQGDQVLSLKAMTHGAPGHSAHTINNLMRALGVPMMSNRYDRDNYVDVHWTHAKKGKERLLEKSPKAAWVAGIPYDFGSATHAPVNYLCSECAPGDFTMHPLQDTMWRRWLSMGHSNKLSANDATLVNLVYAAQCALRAESGTEAFPYVPTQL